MLTRCCYYSGRLFKLAHNKYSQRWSGHTNKNYRTMIDSQNASNPSTNNATHAGTLHLTLWIVIGLIAGVVVGEFLFRYYGGQVPTTYLQTFEFVGSTFFMNLLKMVLVPLVASSVIVGVSSIGDPSKLGFVGLATISYYFATMAMAVVLGVVLVTTIQPGKDIEKAFRESEQARFESGDTAERQRVESASGSGPPHHPTRGNRIWGQGFRPLGRSHTGPACLRSAVSSQRWAQEIGSKAGVASPAGRSIRRGRPSSGKARRGHPGVIL